MSRPANSKNPVHDPNHPHHIPHLMHNGGALDPAIAAKAMQLAQDGTVHYEGVAEYTESDKADILVIRRVHK